MTTQLLFYEKAVPVSRERHGNWSVKTGSNYLFARNTNSVPLTALEFPNAAAEYAIVFAGSDEVIMPVVILGVQENQNQFIDADGNWDAKFIPAFVRRYPFVFSITDDGANFTLCIDEDFSGCNQNGVGERLFDAEGERTQYLGNVLNFLSEYQAHFKRTQAFCNKLKELDLLESMQAQVTLPSGKKTSLTGFMAINREKLKNLPGDTLAELSKTSELELMYTHLQSMRNFSAMGSRETEPAAPEEVAEATEGEQQETEKKVNTSRSSKEKKEQEK